MFVYDRGGNARRIRAVSAVEILASQFSNTSFPLRIDLGRRVVSIHIQRNPPLPHGSGGGAQSLGEFADGSFFLLHYSSILADLDPLSAIGLRRP